MNDASDQSVNKEAKPLVVGGEASKQKRPVNKRWAKIRLIVAVVVLVVVAAAAGWWFFIRQDPDYLKISQLNSQNTRIAKAQQLADVPLPKKPEDQARHYGLIGAYLAVAKEYTYAERYYLTAQKLADQHKLNSKEYRFYQPLADIYDATGNKQKAEEYKRKESDFMKANYSKEDLEQMEKVQLNGRPR
jgi:hypothetical protein